ncbi:hypothetical protein [Frateuria sp. STR12]|uniref:hypothetical protein n=1 Tax=Frateuria hangzhouensis TaxID=2995589 RepID=UPI002260AF1F|nr:hypothetical protein [Frateuria sp. STR12]MCX7514314.1 hypothetical protein [Frateuria sp. STR12]
MSIYRSILVAGALLLAGPACATEVSMAGGRVAFSAPDAWVPIMQTQGETEMRVFQVPDPSPTARDNLSYVTVVVKQVGDLAAFDQYVGIATHKAQALPGYQPAGTPVGPNSYAYTAQENHVAYRYSERYWFAHNHAIQLRCARPAHSEAGAAWAAAFDKGCDAVAASLAR